MSWLLVHSLRQRKACHPGSIRKLPPPAYQFRPELHSVVGLPLPCTPIVRIWCQSLLPTAFLMYPDFATSAVDAVVAYSCTTDSAWVFTWTLQEAHTTDHNFCLSCIYPQPLPLHGFFPYQEPPDTFLQRVSNGDLHIGPPRELQRETHLTRFPAQWWAREYGSLVDPCLHLKLVIVTLANTNQA